MRPILLWIGLWTGCAEDAAREAASPVATSVQADPELCAEHGVLESVCPKCTPALAAVFQAKGDWCGEHGFPESFCPICAPERGGRPLAQAPGGDGAPADGTLVRFRTRSAAAQAGLEWVSAEGGAWVEGTEAVARLTWDATRVAAVSARAAGVVAAIRAEEGDAVRAGQALAVLRSAHVAGDRSRAAAAGQARDVAAAEVARKQALLAEGVVSQAELLRAERSLAQAEAELSALTAELALVGGGEGDSAVVAAPISGVVLARRVQVGQSVALDQPLFELVDPSRLWAEVEVPERALVDVALGQEVTLRLDALPDEVFTGVVRSIAPYVDPDSRAARARVALENPDGRLRANLYGQAVIRSAAATEAVVVPAAAVQRAGEVQLVFVRQAEDSFVARRVRVLSRQGDRVRISGGVKPGDAVVTTGSFLLKTETLKDSIGAGCCDVE